MNLTCVFRPEFWKVLKQVLIFKHMNNLISVKQSTSACSEFKDHFKLCALNCWAWSWAWGDETRQSRKQIHGVKLRRKRGEGKVEGKEDNVQGTADTPRWIRETGRIRNDPAKLPVVKSRCSAPRVAATEEQGGIQCNGKATDLKPMKGT